MPSSHYRSEAPVFHSEIADTSSRSHARSREDAISEPRWLPKDTEQAKCLFVLGSVSQSLGVNFAAVTCSSTLRAVCHASVTWLISECSAINTSFSLFVPLAFWLNHSTGWQLYAFIAKIFIQLHTSHPHSFTSMLFLLLQITGQSTRTTRFLCHFLGVCLKSKQTCRWSLLVKHLLICAPVFAHLSCAAQTRMTLRFRSRHKVL